MTDATLAEWLREELRGPDGEYLDALLALLWEAEKYIWKGEVRARLRIVLGEGR